jgi:FkbM family methyltransferase
MDIQKGLSQMFNHQFIQQTGYFKWATRYAAYHFRKRILRDEIRMRLPTGSDIVLSNDKAQSSIYITGANVDWGSEERFSRFASRERDFLDIGANIGYYSSYLSPLVRHVYAFEPDPRNTPSLRRNAGLCKNIVVVEKAVSDRDGVANLSVGGGATTNSLESRPGLATIQVPTISIDSFVDQNPQLDVGLIKTDIEGHDLHALRGMERSVAKFQPLILSEIVIDKELMDLTTRWNYRVFAFTCDRLTYSMEFKENPEGDPPSDWYKMVFLAPKRTQW